MRIRPKQIDLTENVAMQGGLIQLSDGNLASPSLTFGSLTGTGFYNDNGNMALVANGTKTWELDSSSAVLRYTLNSGFGAPKGTTLQRPSAEAAVFRYNTDLSNFEFSDGLSWSQIETKKTWTFTGDATGSGNGSIALTLANSGVTAGTYNSVTVNAKGIVTGGYSAGTTGKVVTGNIASLSSTAFITLGNITPLVTDGVQVFSDSITPTNTTSKVIVSCSFAYSASKALSLIVSAFRGSTCIGATVANFSAANNKLMNLSCEFEDLPGSTSAQTYSLRAVADTNGSTWYINETNTALLNGMMAKNSYMLLEIL